MSVSMRLHYPMYLMRQYYFLVTKMIVTNTVAVILMTSAVVSAFLLVKKPINECVAQQRLNTIEQSTAITRGACALRCSIVNCFAMVYTSSSSTCNLFSLNGTENVLTPSVECSTMLDMMLNEALYGPVACGGYDIQSAQLPNRRFLVLNEEKTWELAKSHCESINGMLVHIWSQEENDVIQNLSQGAIHVGLAYIDAQWYWTGKTNKPADYTNWSPGEPNYLPGESRGTMNPNGLWNNVYPSTSFRFMCECPPY